MSSFVQGQPCEEQRRACLSSLHRKSVHFSPAPHPLLGTQTPAPESMYTHGNWNSLREADPRERDRGRDTHRDRDRDREKSRCLGVHAGQTASIIWASLGPLGLCPGLASGLSKQPRQSGPCQAPPWLRQHPQPLWAHGLL